MGKRRHSLLIKYLNLFKYVEIFSIAILICNHTFWKAMKTLGVDTSSAAAYSTWFNWCWILMTVTSRFLGLFCRANKEKQMERDVRSTQLAPHNQHWQAQHQLNWTCSKRPKILNNLCIVSQQKDQQQQLFIYTSTHVPYWKLSKNIKTPHMCVNANVNIRYH